MMSDEKDDNKKSCIECQGIMIRLEMTSKVLNTTVTESSANLDKLVELIKGNGQPGINERLRVIEARELVQGRTFHIWFDRMWKVLVSIGVGALLLHMKGTF